MSRSRGAAAFVYAALVFVFTSQVWRHGPTAYTNFVILAQAWAHGHNWIAWPGDYIDAVPFHGRAYIVEAPMPAILLFPIVLVFGSHTSQTLFASAMGAVAVYAAWRLCRRVGLGSISTLAATTFLYFGTSLFVCSAVGDVWYVSHVCAVAFTLFALGECFGRRRAWLVSIWAICAGFSRYPLLAIVPLYLALLLVRAPKKITLDRFSIPLIPALVGWALYNYSRWGTLFDPGFPLFYRIMDTRYIADTPMFSLKNVGMQAHAMIFDPPSVSSTPPWIAPQLIGFGILYTSLPFAYAVAAGISFEAIVLWFASLVTVLPAITYYDAGGGQFGSRHALDFEPYLFALLAMALRRRPSKIVVWALFAFAAFSAVAGIVWIQEQR